MPDGYILIPGAGKIPTPIHTRWYSSFGRTIIFHPTAQLLVRSFHGGLS
jgi:hypothetical protein